MHSLVSMVPDAANAAWYARIVAHRAVLRRLVEAGTRTAQLGYGAVSETGVDPADVVDVAQQWLYDIIGHAYTEDLKPVAALVGPALEAIEVAGSRPPCEASAPACSTWTPSPAACGAASW